MATRVPIPPSPSSQLMHDFTGGLSLTSPTSERISLARQRSEASVPQLAMGGPLLERRDSCGTKRRHGSGYVAPSDSSLSRTRTLAALNSNQLPPQEELFAKPAPRTAKCGSPKNGDFAPPPPDPSGGFLIRKRVTAGRSKLPMPPSPVTQSPVISAPPVVVCTPVEVKAAGADKENADPEYSVRQLTFDDPMARSPRSPTAISGNSGSFSRQSFSARTMELTDALPALQMSSSPVLKPRGRSKIPRLSGGAQESGSDLALAADGGLATARSVPTYIGRPPLPVPVPCPSDVDRMDLSTFSSVGSTDVSVTSADSCPFEVASVLPTVSSSENPDVRCISVDTLANIIENPQSSTKVNIVDCRYPYEFEGGHIVGAKNYWLPRDMEEQLFAQPQRDPIGEAAIWIFHCEFSSKRAPHMWRHIRDLDRRANAAHYPNLFYPQIFVVEGGYSRFYERFRHLCTPPGYVQMLADSARCRQFKTELKKGYHRSRNDYLTRSASM